LCLGCASTQTPPIHPESLLTDGEAPPSRAHRFDNVLVIVLENQDFADVMKDRFLSSLAARGATFTHFRGLFHPSYANYLAMAPGRLIPTSGDRQIDVDFPTLGERLTSQNLTWRNYAEGYPGDSGRCFLAASQGKYARKHVPFLSFVGVQKDGCANVVPGAQFLADWKAGTLPHYAFFSPDLDNDGHDPVTDPPKGLGKASRWLEEFLTPLLADAAFRKRTLVVVTYDESLGSNRENPIYTV